MLAANIDLAQRIERAEIEFCAAAAGHDSVASLEAGGGRALFSVSGSPLNKVLGLGVGAVVSDADLDAIERFYRSHVAHVRMELCPVGTGDLAARLSARGYALQEFENELGRRLPRDDDERRALRAAIVAPLRVTQTTAGEDDEWVRIVAEGFANVEGSADAASATAVDQVAEIMRTFTAPGIVRYIARIDGAAAGGGATFGHGGVLGIFCTATPPRFRRRGVQAAIVRQALADAPVDADVAVATTEPAATSQRTFERLGFQVLYTRTIMVLPCHDVPDAAGT